MSLIIALSIAYLATWSELERGYREYDVFSLQLQHNIHCSCSRCGMQQNIKQVPKYCCTSKHNDEIDQFLSYIR